MSYEIRLARFDEVAYLAPIERAAGRLFPADRIVDPEQTMPAALLTRACEQGLLFLAVALADDRPVGFASCTELDGYLHLDELSVHPEHGRQGLGRSLVERVIEDATERGLAGVTLTTFADLPWNGPFYRSMGFVALDDERLSEPLAAALAHERAHGLTERIAMRRRIELSDEERGG